MITIAGKEKDFEVSQHILVPKHTKLSQKEKEELLSKYRISLKDLPKISIKDPAISGMELTTKDVIKVERPSLTSKQTVFFRKVVK